MLLAVSCTGDFKKDYSVEKPAVKSVSLDKNDIVLLSGYDVTLKATIDPPNATNKELWWASDNPAVATVLGGTVIAKADGVATITVTTQSGEKTDKCVVTVPTVLLESVSTTKELTLVVGEPAHKLTFTTVPSHATNRKVSWKTNKPEVAEVDENGVITPLATGVANITLTTEDGKHSAFCRVTVLENLLKNGGFELPTRVTNLNPQTWEPVQQTWFKEYSDANPDFTPAALKAATTILARASVLSLMYTEFFKTTGGGYFFLSASKGTWMGIMGDAKTAKDGITCGLYQNVSVGAGTYKVRATVGFRCDNASASIKRWESIKILNPNGSTLNDNQNKPIEVPIDTKNIKLYNNRPSCVVEVEGYIEIPLGITQVRFQIDQRSFQSPHQAPTMLFDNLLFARMP